MAKILVVDDSKAILAATRELLEAAGHTVTVQDSPAGLPAVLNREHPDLILLDVSMPTLDGDQALRLVRARGVAMTSIVLLFSAKPVAELEKLVKVCGADGYVSKTDLGPALVAVVNERLAARPKVVDDIDVSVE